MSETNQLIFNFLKRFSSFENTLRITNSVQINGNATIEFSDVKKNLEKRNFTFTDEQKGLEIIKNPPKLQRYETGKGGLYWELGKIGTSDSDLAINVLVRVRNNLFHGSKKFGDSSESERNVDLISDALIILDAVVKSLDIGDVYQDTVDYWN